MAACAAYPSMPTAESQAGVVGSHPPEVIETLIGMALLATVSEAPFVGVVVTVGAALEFDAFPFCRRPVAFDAFHLLVRTA